MFKYLLHPVQILGKIEQKKTRAQFTFWQTNLMCEINDV